MKMNFINKNVKTQNLCCNNIKIWKELSMIYKIKLKNQITKINN